MDSVKHKVTGNKATRADHRGIHNQIAYYLPVFQKVFDISADLPASLPSSLFSLSLLLTTSVGEYEYVHIVIAGNGGCRVRPESRSPHNRAEPPRLAHSPLPRWEAYDAGVGGFPPAGESVRGCAFGW